MSTELDISTVTLLSAAGIQPLKPGTYTAPTDGFAFGVANGAVSADGTAFTWIMGTCGPISAVASGGQLAYLPNGTNSSEVGGVAVGTSFLLPVPANNPFTLTVNPSSVNATSPVVTLLWVPMGNGAATPS